MAEQSPTSFKISNRDRIIRMLRRICEANIPVLIRYSTEVTVAVKARASYLVVDSQPAYIRLSDLSAIGKKHLEGKDVIQVEFVMMSTKVQFVSRIIASAEGSVMVEIPKMLYSVERRKNMRYTATPDLSCFLRLNIWKPEADDPTGPPLGMAPDLAAMMRVVDISQTGLAVVSRFPSVARAAKRGAIDDNAQLLLPMQRPVKVGVEVRWGRRIKERAEAEGQTERVARSFRFGVEFQNPSEEAKLSLAHYIQQISQAEAV